MHENISVSEIDDSLIASLFPKRSKNAHKGNFGHCLLVAGSRGMAGAAILSAEACLRSGCGLLTVQIPDSIETAIQTKVPEAMCISDGPLIRSIMWNDAYNALGMGPGLRSSPETIHVVKEYLALTHVVKVLDADALNAISENKWHASLNSNCVITPHHREFERLLGKSFDEKKRIEMARAFSLKFETTVVLKGHETIISSANGHVWKNVTGNPGMAKGGSGDVLTGMILAFLAQGFKPEMAAIAGVFLHGRAGDLACEKYGEQSILARDLVAHIPLAFQSIID